MAQCVVIADDLTGGNATGVLFNKLNYRTLTVLNFERAKEVSSDCDCIIYPTDSRALDTQKAYDKVKDALAFFKSDEISLYCHRIDSTLRGNVGSETDAMLDLLGDDYVAIVAPAFPSSGRTVCGGYLLVNGIPLHKTDIAIDPKTPVTISDVSEVIRQDSKYKVANLYINDLMHGKHKLAQKILDKVNEGNRIIVLDCITQEDLELIADAVVTSKLKCIAVDPGVFSSTLARKIFTPHEKKNKIKVLATIGSVHPMTSMQVKELLLSQRVNAVETQTVEFLISPKRKESEIERVTNAILENYDKYYVSVVFGDGLKMDSRIDFKPFIEKYHCSLDEVTDMINSAFAEITYRIMQKAPEFRGLYTSGGDITVSVCKRLSTSGIDLKDEVLPLAAYGMITDGPFKGVHLITKGGSQGNKDAIKECIEYLKKILFI